MNHVRTYFGSTTNIKALITTRQGNSISCIQNKISEGECSQILWHLLQKYVELLEKRSPLSTVV